MGLLVSLELKEQAMATAFCAAGRNWAGDTHLFRPHACGFNKVNAACDFELPDLVWEDKIAMEYKMILP